MDGIHSKTQENWLEDWKKYEEEASQKLLSKLNTVEVLTDGHVFHHVSKQVPENWNVILSNSLPVRDMLTFGKSEPYQFVNRGAAGIDGILSTALGIHFSTDKPICCLIGDLAFLHDSNALYTLQQVSDQPFVAVVLNNRGGNIFQMLPVYRNEKKAVPKEIYQTYFETPQKTDISHLAKASGIQYKKIVSLSGLNELDLNQIRHSVIIECETAPKASMNLRIELLTS